MGMALMKHEERLHPKKTLLTVIEDTLENKEFNAAQEGKNEKRLVEVGISIIENEVLDAKTLIESRKSA
jgi:hypothetical protein